MMAEFENAKWQISHGVQYPYDATDAWWDGDADTPHPATDWAHAAARGIIANLDDRRGFKHALHDGIDEETRVDIVHSIAAIIRAGDEVR